MENGQNQPSPPSLRRQPPGSLPGGQTPDTPEGGEHTPSNFRSCQFGSGRDGLIQNGSRTILGNEEHVPKPTKLNMPLHSSISPVHTRAFGVTLLFDSSARAVTTVKYNSRHTRDMHWEYAYGPHLCRQHRRPQAPNTQRVTPACFTLTPQREASSRDGIHPKASHLAQPLRSRVPPPEAVPQYKGGWAGQTFGPASLALDGTA